MEPGPTVASLLTVFSSRRGLIRLLAIALLSGCAQMPADPESEPPVVVAHVEAPAPEADLEVRPELEPAPPPVAEAPPPPPAAPEPEPIWDRIRAGFQLDDIYNARVRAWESWYSTRPDYVARMIEQSSYFLYYILEEVERRGFPSEIALLPMIESAYNPYAYSRAHAAGMWQFIPSTARLYGLRQTFWYDGRRDVLAATTAALDYLQKLHEQFKDWRLALAAYNMGEGALTRAIARNQARRLPTTYERLRLPRETRDYLPKLQAVKNIITNPEQYGLSIAAVPNKPYFETVVVPRHIDVEVAAALAEMSVEEFRFLNPAHKRPVIRADGSETLVLPVDKVAVFKRNLESYNEPLVTWQAYTVKRNDRPERIAARHGITLAKLKEVNGITGRRRIVPGQTILVPHRGDAEPHLPDIPLARSAPRGRARR